MPQLLILLAAGAGVFLVRRWYRDEQRRIAADLARARKAMDQQAAGTVVRLERDPSTGVYRPKGR
jgi:Tfp pilus assembly protein PilN